MEKDPQARFCRWIGVGEPRGCCTSGNRGLGHSRPVSHGNTRSKSGVIPNIPRESVGPEIPELGVVCHPEIWFREIWICSGTLLKEQGLILGRFLGSDLCPCSEIHPLQPTPAASQDFQCWIQFPGVKSPKGGRAECFPQGSPGERIPGILAVWPSPGRLG